MSDDGIVRTPGRYSLFLPGTQVGNYRVEAFIDRGGMSVVYKARDVNLERVVALKVLTPDLSQDGAFRERFLRESRFAASLDHPNIIPIFDAGEFDGLLYIAMRYVQGGTLKTALRENGPFGPEAAVQVLTGVAHALDAAHDRGLVHRDVKPANILMAGGGAHPEAVYLSDFGLTKHATSMSGLTATGSFIGTLAYVAPEQISGLPVDAKADQYALGCVAFETLSGTGAFVRDDEAALLWAHLSEPPASLATYVPDLAAADPVFSVALAKEPAQRYPSCSAFISALGAALLDQSSMTMTRSRPASPPPPRTSPEQVAGSSAGPVAGPVGGSLAGPVAEPVAGSGPVPPTTPESASKPDAPPPPRGPQTSRRRLALVAGGIVVGAAVAIAAVATQGNNSTNKNTGPPRAGTSSRSTSAAALQSGAITAANAAISAGQKVESDVRRHADIMGKVDSGQLQPPMSYTAPVPSLIHGAGDSVRYDDALKGYRQAAARLRSATGASSAACSAALAKADAAVGDASAMVSALTAHTQIMVRMQSGLISGSQATRQGGPSLQQSLASADAFDTSRSAYQQAAKSCP